MRRHLSSIRLPPLVRLLLLFAILIIPLLAGRVITQLGGESPNTSSVPAKPDLAKRS